MNLSNEDVSNLINAEKVIAANAGTVVSYLSNNHPEILVSIIQKIDGNKSKPSNIGYKFGGLSMNASNFYIVKSLILKGKHIDSIKYIREALGCDINAAKEFYYSILINGNLV